jgi:hypothetical protein
MARTTKAQREADRFRQRIIALLAEPDDWRHYEHIRHWLQKLLQRDHGCVYTPAERAAVVRIIAARTPFEGWGGYSIPELITAALRYVADFSYEDEIFLKELEARPATRLPLVDMGQLVGLCRIAGVDLPKFRPEVDAYEEAA